MITNQVNKFLKINVRHHITLTPRGFPRRPYVDTTEHLDTPNKQTYGYTTETPSDQLVLHIDTEVFIGVACCNILV